MISVDKQFAKSNIANEGTAGRALVLGMGATGVSIAAWLAEHSGSAVFADSREQPPGLKVISTCLCMPAMAKSSVSPGRMAKALLPVCSIAC